MNTYKNTTILLLFIASIASSFRAIADDRTSAFSGVIQPTLQKKSLIKAADQIAGAADILLIQTSDPWNSVADPTVLNALGRTYQIADMSQIADGSIDIFSYQVVLIVNDQVQAFYDTLAAETGEFEQYVENGGTLVIFAAANGWANGSITAPLPGGLTRIYRGTSDLYNNGLVADPTHPIVSGVLTGRDPLVNSDLYSTYCTHGFFDTLPAGSRIILTDTDYHPTLIEYNLGKGTVIASTHTWEYTYDRPQFPFGRKALPDVFLYAFSVHNLKSEGISVKVWPEDNRGYAKTLYKAPGDLIDVCAEIQNNVDTNIPNVTLTANIDASLVDPSFIKVYQRSSEDAIAVEMPVAVTSFTDSTSGGTRTITVANLNITPQTQMPPKFGGSTFNDYVFRFRLRNPLVTGTPVDATASVSASGFNTNSQSISAGCDVVIFSPRIILTSREGLYKQYVRNGNTINRDQATALHKLWASMYGIAAERFAVIEFADKEEYETPADNHSVTSDVLGNWPDHRNYLANGINDLWGNYHYDGKLLGDEETLPSGVNAINQVAFKVRTYLNNYISRSGGIPANGRGVLILGGDSIVPFFRLWDEAVFNDKGEHDASQVTLVDAENGYLFSDLPYRDYGNLNYRSGEVDDVGIGRIAGPDLDTMRKLLASGDNIARSPNVVKQQDEGFWGKLDAFQTLCSSDNYNVITSVEGVTLDDSPNIVGYLFGYDPERWNPTFKNLFNELSPSGEQEYAFDVIRFCCHGAVEAIGTSDQTTLIFNGADIKSANAFDNTYPFFIFDSCLVGIVDGNQTLGHVDSLTDGLLNNLFAKQIRGVVANSAVSWPYICSPFLDRFCSPFIGDGVEAGVSLSRAIKADAVAGPEDHQPLTRMEVNYFGSPWAIVSHPTAKNNAIAKLNALSKVSKASLTIAQNNGAFSSATVIGASNFSVQKLNGYDVLTVTGGFNLFNGDGLPVLPYGEFDIPVPNDAVITNVLVVFEQDTNLGTLNVPAFKTPDPMAADTNAPYDYVPLPAGVGAFPTNRYTQGTWNDGGQTMVKFVVFPAQLTAAKQTILAQKITISFDYITSAMGVVSKFTTDQNSYGPGENAVTTTTIQNTSDTNVVFTVTINILDLSGNVVATQTNSQAIASGQSADIGVTVQTPSTPGAYRVQMTASDNVTQGTTGTQDKFIRVQNGLLIYFSVPPTMIPGQPNVLEASIQSLATNAQNALVDISVFQADGLQVAKLPEFGASVQPMGTTNLDTFWIPATNLVNGTFYATAIVTVNGFALPPIVDYFQLGTSTFEDVSQYTTNKFNSWTLDPATGALVCSLVIGNNTGSPKTLNQKFYFVLPSSATVKLANPTGILPDGTPYLDITAQVEAALPGVGNGDLNLDPGEQVTISGIEIYSADRSIPQGFIFAMWADPPVSNASSSSGLQLVRSQNGTHMLSWPLGQTGYVLQVADSLTSTNWTTIPTTPVIRGSANTIPIPIGTSGSKFYRMKKQ